MLAAVGDDEDLQQPGGSGVGVHQQQHQQQQPRPGMVQLGDFWPQAPNGWFAAPELKFEAADITDERDRFAHFLEGDIEHLVELRGKMRSDKFPEEWADFIVAVWLSEHCTRACLS